MKRTAFFTVFLAALLLAGQAFAIDLNQARREGYVGEKQDGYVAVIKAAPGVAEMVNDVNARRQAEYARIAAQNGQPLAVVARLAAEQVIGGLPAGALYQNPAGGWVKK